MSGTGTVDFREWVRMKVRIAVVVIGALLGAGVLGTAVASAAPQAHSVSAPAGWGSPIPVGTPTTH